MLPFFRRERSVMGEHDTFFKRVFSVSENAAAEIASVLPAELVRAVDLTRLTPVNGSFVSEEMENRHTDLLFRARFKRRPQPGKAREHGEAEAPEDKLEGQEGYFYFLFEHLSEPDATTLFRLLEYIVRVWGQLLREKPTRKTLPLVVPLVVHHGPRGWSGPRTLHELIEHLDEHPGFGPFVPNFAMLLDDLIKLTDGDIHQREMPDEAKLATWLLRDGRNTPRLIAHLPAWGATFDRLTRARPGETVALLGYLLSISAPHTRQTIRDAIAQNASTTEAHMYSIADQLRDEGREQGIQQGIQELLRTLRDVLRTLLSTRFGPLPAELQARIDVAGREELDRAVKRVLIAESLEDVFA